MFRGESFPEPSQKCVKCRDYLFGSFQSHLQQIEQVPQKFSGVHLLFQRNRFSLWFERLTQVKSVQEFLVGFLIESEVAHHYCHTCKLANPKTIWYNNESFKSDSELHNG